MLDYFTSQKEDLLKFLQVVQRLAQQENQYLVLLSCMFLGKKECLCVMCIVICIFLFWRGSFSDHFKDDISPSLKSHDRLKFDQDVAINNVREKCKPQCKISIKLFE